MATYSSIDIRSELVNLFPDALLRRLARECGAVMRSRKIDPVTLFWTLVLGFGLSDERSFAQLRQRYQLAAGRSIAASSFQERFTPKLARLFRHCLERALQESLGGAQALKGPLAGFRDVVLADATIVRLHWLLEKAFPACRTNHTRAAAKLHVVMNICGVSKQLVQLTDERTSDNKRLQIGPWVRGKLLLFDLGYYDFRLFACMGNNGSYFLSRLKRNANPRITAVYRTHRGRAIPLVGRTLQEVLPWLQREILDAEVEVSYRKRPYRGQQRTATLRLRLVGIRDGQSGEYHLYLTNVPVKQLPAKDLQTTYALRWEIELLFKELKSNYRLDQLPSRRQEVVETFLYVAILSLVVSRRLLQAVRQALPEHQAERFKTQRFARLLAELSGQLLLVLLAPARETRWLRQQLATTLLNEAVDPNKHRNSLLQNVEQGVLPYAPKA